MAKVAFMHIRVWYFPQSFVTRPDVDLNQFEINGVPMPPGKSVKSLNFFPHFQGSEKCEKIVEIRVKSSSMIFFAFL